MKFLLRILLILALGYLASTQLPWWSVAVAGFVTGLLLSEKIKRRRLFGKQPPSAKAFLSGFIAVFILWSGFAWWSDFQNDSLLSEKISRLIVSEGETYISRAWIMILVTGLIGGLVGGFSTMTGNLLGEMIRGQEKD